ncbi:hypothetical protein J7L13_00195 [bacterium]|nr:hypothetical protein [bacterium]
MSVIETPITNFVDCIELPEKKGVWKKHTKERVSLASLTAYNMSCAEMSFTRASKIVAETYGVSYRRLQEYMKTIGIVYKHGRKYEGYGKVLIYDVFLYYDSSKNEKRSRNFEARLFFPVPLDFLDYNTNDFLEFMKKEVIFFMKYLPKMEALVSYLEWDENKTGVFPFYFGFSREGFDLVSREFSEFFLFGVHPDRDVWCNEIFNFRLRTPPYLEVINLSNGNVYRRFFKEWQYYFCDLEKSFKDEYGYELYVPVVAKK